MVFEPISGTIGAVALLDPALRGSSWIYGKYKLQKLFGDHYQAETIKYRSEVARFVYIRDQKIDVLRSNPLNESETFFTSAFRDRLILAVNALEECEGLVAKHDPKFLKEEQGKPDQGEANPSSANSGPQPEDAGSSTASLRGANIKSSREPTTANTTLSTHPTSGSGRSKDKSRSPLSQLFSRRARKEKEQSTPPSVAARQVQVASTDLHKQQKTLEDTRIQQQKESRFAERLQWLAGERSRFIYLNKEIRRHNDYFLSFVGPWKSRLNKEASSRSGTDAISTRTRSVASHLRRLIRSLGAIKDSNRVCFQMMLLESPFELRSRMGESLPTEALLRASSSMFPFKILKNPAKVGVGSAPLPQDNISLIFEVPSPEQKSEDVKRQVGERPMIESFAGSFPPPAGPENEGDENDNRPWWAVIGIINDIATSTKDNEPNEPISIFHDRATYIQTKTLQASFTDPVDAKFMGNIYLAYRLRLAYVLASSFIYFVLADYPLDLFSKSLFYYSESATEPGPDMPDLRVLAESRVSPYVQLRAIGAMPTPKSFSSILTSAVDPASKDQIIVHRLGVLLCEVGRWKPVGSSSTEDWRSLSSEASTQAVDLVRCAPIGYRKVVQSCLEFTPKEIGTVHALVSWLESNVVLPLRGALDGLGPEFGMT